MVVRLKPDATWDGPAKAGRVVVVSGVKYQDRSYV